jgi:hypothetical protein
LFVVPDFQQWGIFDPSTDEIHLHREEKTGDEDLLKFGATQSLLNGGIVSVAEPGKIPDTGSSTALFRYQFSTIFDNIPPIPLAVQY